MVSFTNMHYVKESELLVIFGQAETIKHPFVRKGQFLHANSGNISSSREQCRLLSELKNVAVTHSAQI